MSAAESQDKATTGTAKPAAGGNQQEELGDGHVSGNLTQDPELRFTPTGRAVAKLRVAYSERVKDEATGKWLDGEPQYFDIDVWGKQGEHCAENLQRGDRIVAVGTWYSRTWEDREGNKRSTISLTARDIGPSMLFRQAKIVRSRHSGPPMGGPPPQHEQPPGDEPQEEPPF